MRKTIAALGIAAILLGACATKVPVPQAGMTQLLISVETETMTENELSFFGQYKMTLDTGETFRVYPEEGFYHITDLPPGDYEISSCRAYYIDSGTYGPRHEMNISFTLEENTITILPKVFKIVLFQIEGDNKYHQSIHTQRFLDSKKEAAEEYLSQYENIELWDIR